MGQRPDEEQLSRSLRFVDVYALAVGSVIGSGIFFMPGKAAAEMGPAALLAFLIAAALASLLVLCYAEAASRFRSTGGAMTYAQHGLGDVWAFEVGWATWVARVASWAALANLFVTSVTALWPSVEGARTACMAALFGVLTAINLRGVLLGARMNTILTAAKLAPLLLFIFVGAFHVEVDAFTPFAPQGYAPLGTATVLVMFAFVGFEGMVIPAAEVRDPRRNVPRALMMGMATIAFIYIAVWAVCTGTLPQLASSENPVGDAAATFMGETGTSVVLVGIMISVAGINAFTALITPRALYALSRAELLPPWFARVSANRVPSLAIWVTAITTFALALSRNFVDLAVISVLARIAQYIPTCLAVMRLRRMPDAPEAQFRAPFGAAVPTLAIVVCAWLVLETEPERVLWGAVALAAGLLIYVPWRMTRR